MGSCQRALPKKADDDVTVGGTLFFRYQEQALARGVGRVERLKGDERFGHALVSLPERGLVTLKSMTSSGRYWPPMV